uniref:Putative secreted peptide n=1 Tax=Anopheles braziliensis TaxID=58242 RepID=A0A2M3ZUN7_9DIPT
MSTGNPIVQSMMMMTMTMVAILTLGRVDSYLYQRPIGDLDEASSIGELIELVLIERCRCGCIDSVRDRERKK